MSDHHRLYEIRCPVHRFVTINDWEREIINQPAFQRLRRIRQLAWTDYVYPGAMHTRFEHSLGVFHVANLMYEAIRERSAGALQSELRYNDDGLKRDRIIVRIAALLHDIGHSPFSHASEELFPTREDGASRYEHEDYSAAIIRTNLRNVIEDHPLNKNYGLTADQIADLIEGNASAGGALFWRELITGQIDADRMDYLLRDSLHCGVDYGRYDLPRLVNTVQVIASKDQIGPRLGVSEGGVHAAEGLVLARYFMFTQVYFHKTRIAFNHHLQRALAEMLPEGCFPRPVGGELKEFLAWDDWRVLGALARGEGGEHGRRLANRDHYREVYHTPEAPRPQDIRRLEQVRQSLGDLLMAEEIADKSWYKVGKPDIPVITDNPRPEVVPLSRLSSAISGLAPVERVMLFCRKEDFEEARRRLSSVSQKRRPR
jgi:uncharacterized protein